MGSEIISGILLVAATAITVYTVFVLVKLHLLLKEAERFLEELENEK